MTLETRGICDSLGVEIRGLDLREALSDATQDELRALLDEHKLLYFPGQTIDADDQIRVVSVFGPVADEMDDGLYHSFVSNVEGVQFPQTRLLFHQDYSFTVAPPPVLSLCAIEVEGPPVTTIWANNIRAYRSLHFREQHFLEDKNAVHVTDHSPESREMGAERRRTRLPLVEGPTPTEYFPRTSHPVVLKHPRTGELVLFVNEYFSSHIEDVAFSTSESFMQHFFRRLYVDANCYEHTWTVGDFILWDNIALQHARGDVIPESRRTLRRVLVSERRVNELYEAATGRVGVTPRTG